MSVHSKRFYTTGEVANAFDMTVNTIKKWISEGKLKASVTPGGHYRIKSEEFDKLSMKFNLSGQDKRILVVDDNDMVLELLIETISNMDEKYIIESSSDGYDAMIKIGEFNPDLLVIDLKMPKIDGYSVIKSIHCNPTAKNIKIIVVSAYPEEFGKVRQYVHHIIPKPIDLKVLRNRIIELL